MGKEKYTAIKKCRICGNENLVKVIDLNNQALTGVFPKSKFDTVTSGPIHLVKCHGTDNCCGLLQMAHTYDLDEMYGNNYGYRSGLNASMVAHLKAKADRIKNMINLKPGDIVVDIGSNDCTSLKFYDNLGLHLVGIDPTGKKFKQFYPAHIQLIPDFFSGSLFKDRFTNQEASIVTSYSMFYDLEAPLNFAKDVFSILKDGGIWVFEQSYMPTMLEMNSYDTACHEHLEYYALKQIKWICDNTGFTITDLEFNDVNGGSFSITAKKGTATESPLVKTTLNKEKAMGLDGLEPFREFQLRSEATRQELLKFLKEARSAGKKVAAIGASTKGNVLLQFCGITPEQVYAVGEVNTDKYGCYTPGSLIPIVNEDDLLKEKPDFLIVLPWHFKDFFIANPKFKLTSLVFPLPHLTVIPPSLQ